LLAESFGDDLGMVPAERARVLGAWGQPRRSAVNAVIYVLTAWNERTGEDVVQGLLGENQSGQGLGEVRGQARDLWSDLQAHGEV